MLRAILGFLLGATLMAGGVVAYGSFSGDAYVNTELYNRGGNRVTSCDITCDGVSSGSLEGCEIDWCY